MKAADLREKTVEELEQEHISLLRQQFKLRLSANSDELTKTSELKDVRRNIARLLTVKNEKLGESK